MFNHTQFHPKSQNGEYTNSNESLNNTAYESSSSDSYQYIQSNASVSTSEDSRSQSKQYSDVDINMANNNSMISGENINNNNNNNNNIKVDDDECMESKTCQKQNTLEYNGYIYHRNIAKTLQGEIFEAINTNNNNEIVVIKKAFKQLVNDCTTIRHGQKIKIKEDIKREIEIMKYLNNNNTIPSEHIKLINIFEDEECIYVVTEHGGLDFFQWIVAAHKKIETGELNIRYWWKNIKFLFKQMVKYVSWLHENNICHLDISLENMLLQNGDYFYNTGKFTRSQQVKFCDFGLSEYFETETNPSFICNKHVGKESYMAPEVWTKTQTFDARQADSWSLGVILFIMISGAPAYSKPDIMNDKAFQYIIYQKIPSLLASWRRLHYIDAYMLDLLQKIFILDPSKRLTIQQIKNHQWLQ